MARRLIATLNIDVQRVVTVTGGGRIFGVSTLDIVKPWPVNVLERRLPGGWGVIFDDLAAGAMAGMILTLALLVIGPA